MNVEQRKRLSSQQQSTVNRLALPKKRELVVSANGAENSDAANNGYFNNKEANRATTPQSLVSDSVNENANAAVNNHNVKKVLSWEGNLFFKECTGNANKNLSNLNKTLKEDRHFSNLWILKTKILMFKKIFSKQTVLTVSKLGI
jgi:hypothetical protein